MASSDPHARSDARFQLGVFALLVVLGCVLYGFTLNYPFVFDDYIYLVDNPFFKDLRNFAFFHDFAGFVKSPARMGLDPDLAQNLISRPVTYLTFHANYVLDGMRPRGFRGVNIALHIANAMLVFLIVSALLRATTKRTQMAPASLRFIPVVTAVVFVAHPLLTESVTYVVQRFTSLGALFYLAAILAYLKSSASADRSRSRTWKISSVVLYVLGMFAQETAVTIPVMIVAIDVFFMGVRFKESIRRAVPYLVFLPVIPALMIMMSLAESDGAMTASHFFNIANTKDAPLDSMQYTLTQASVVLSYLRLVLIPHGLNVDIDYPASVSFYSARFLLSLALIGALVEGAWLLRRRHPRDARAALVFLMVVWYFVTLSVSSSVITLGDFMAEHRAYLPAVGAVTALVCILDIVRVRLQGQIASRKVFAALLVAWIATLGALTMLRNFTWHSNIALWRDAAEQSPDKWRPWANLGAAYAEAKQFPEAVACTKRVLQKVPASLHANRNLGTMENSAGHHAEALAASEAGLRYWPRDFALWLNKGIALHQLGQIDKSAEAFQIVVEEKPGMRKAQILLAVSLTELGQYEKALKAYRDANALAPLEDDLKRSVAAIEAELIRKHGSK